MEEVRRVERERAVEIVLDKLRYEYLPLVQEVVDAIRG